MLIFITISKKLSKVFNKRTILFLIKDLMTPNFLRQKIQQIHSLVRCMLLIQLINLLSLKTFHVLIKLPSSLLLFKLKVCKSYFNYLFDLFYKLQIYIITSNILTIPIHFLQFHPDLAFKVNIFLNDYLFIYYLINWI